MWDLCAVVQCFGPFLWVLVIGASLLTAFVFVLH